MVKIKDLNKGFTFSRSEKAEPMLKYFLRLAKSSIGFTLIELLLVIAIIGILVTIALIAINPIKIINDTNDTKKRTEMNQIKAALQLYYNDNNEYPDATEFVTSGAPPNFINSTYMRQLPSWWVTSGNYSVSSPVPTGEYRAGVVLANPNPDGNDTQSKDKCTSSTIPSSGGTWATADYFICPD